MKRRSFLAGLLLAPLAKFLPAPKLPPPVHVGTDMAHESDSTSIWLISWGMNHVRNVYTSGGFHYAKVPVLPTNWLKRELNK